MEIPAEAVKYILYQRTAYLFLWNLQIVKLFHNRIPRQIYHWLVASEALLRKKAIVHDYLLDISGEYKVIEEYLPAKCENFLDIGCGVAGIDVFIYKHYDNRPCAYLLDKSQLEKSIYYSFKRKGAFYNSLNIAREVLAINGIAAEKINLIEANDNNDINVSKKMDLIISLISWGYHYPVEVYIEQVCEKLNVNGLLIIDIRKQSDGLAELKKYFSSVIEIHATDKYTRVLCQDVMKTSQV